MITLEQLVAPDSWARIIDLFVDILPIDELGFKHVKLQSEGRPPYNPVTLLKLYLYGYKHSIRSSRKLEHSCKINEEEKELLESKIKLQDCEQHRYWEWEDMQAELFKI